MAKLTSECQAEIKALRADIAMLDYNSFLIDANWLLI
jgi:hypothetical protein